MAHHGTHVYPEFRFEHHPGMRDAPDVDIGYPLKQVPTSADTTAARSADLGKYPEIDFRTLANSLTDDWTIPNTKYLTHALLKHPAIFIPHIPSYLIRQFTTPETTDGDRPLILDPFSGSGTTGVEAKVNGRDYLGIEINPLSYLVSEVATSPIPPTALTRAEDAYLELLAATEDRVYDEYDTKFPDNTKKDHWFEPDAITGLTRVRKALADFKASDFDPVADLTESEHAVVDDRGLDTTTLRTCVNRWLTLVIGNTVFKVSNADPDVAKAHKSQKMRRKLETDEHPPDVLDTHRTQLAQTKSNLIELWNEIYPTTDGGGMTQRPLDTDAEVGDLQSEPIHGNTAHEADVDIRLADARSFRFPDYKTEVDLAITSPPYINAVNYFRGSKLRLYWLYDFLDDDKKLDVDALRRSIVGTNSVVLADVDRELPATMRSIWWGTDDEFDATRLPRLDTDIEAIHTRDQQSAPRKAYVVWRFFARDMLQNLARVYEHLKSGAYYVIILGENTIGERLIRSHTYVADIAQHLGKFEGHGGDFDADEGFRLVGVGWDSISRRDLFRGRNHASGVIECEWTIFLQKR